MQNVHCYLARTGVAAVAASAAMLSVSPEDSGRVGIDTACEQVLDADKPKWGWSHAIASFTEWLRDAIASVVEVVGAPPRRPLDEPDPSLALLWAGDIAILCVVAGLILLIGAFTANNSPWSAGEDTKVASFSKAAPSAFLEISHRLTGRVSVTAVVLLSAVAGGTLNIKHALRSALLCGM